MKAFYLRNYSRRSRGRLLAKLGTEDAVAAEVRQRWSKFVTYPYLNGADSILVVWVDVVSLQNGNNPVATVWSDGEHAWTQSLWMSSPLVFPPVPPVFT